MSKSKFKVGRGLAIIKTTGEPVFITGFADDYAMVVRAVVTTDGIQHRTEQFPIEQLETPFEQAKRSVEMEAFVQGLREESERKRYELKPQMINAIKAAASAANPSSRTGKQLSFEGMTDGA